MSIEMSIDCRIELGFNAKSNRILDVMQKIVGQPHTYGVFRQEKFDINEPSSKENPWRIIFERTLGKTTGSDMVGCFHLHFKTLDGQEHTWFGSMETEQEDSMILLPGSHYLSMLIGKRLVDFFGGRVLFSDAYDWDDSRYVHKNNKPVYGKKLKTQSGDERFYQFFNELKKLEPLNEQDLLFFNNKGINLGSEGLSFVYEVSKTVMHRNLQEKLPKKTGENKKLKV